LAHVDRDWIHILKRPIYYVCVLKATHQLDGCDYTVTANPPQEVTADLVGRLAGPNARASLLFFMDDLKIDRSHLPELTVA
jgi:hypothetical protein